MDRPCGRNNVIQLARNNLNSNTTTIFGGVSGRGQPSLRFGRVGLRIRLFEACSAFPRVAACVLAEPPTAALFPRSASGHIVPSVNRSESYPAGTNSCRAGFAPAEAQYLFTAHAHIVPDTERVRFSRTFKGERGSPASLRHLSDCLGSTSGIDADACFARISSFRQEPPSGPV